MEDSTDVFAFVPQGSRGCARKRLGDISNTQQRPNKQVIQHVKPLITITPLELLQIENTRLMKLLSDQQEVIEKKTTENQYLKMDLEDKENQLQNLQELNVQFAEDRSTTRFKYRTNAIGSQNPSRNVKIPYELDKAERVRCQHTTNEVGPSKCVEAGESSRAEKQRQQPTKPADPENAEMTLRSPSSWRKPISVDDYVIID